MHCRGWYSLPSFPVRSIPEIALELVRSVYCTEIFHRCNKNFAKFCSEGKVKTINHRGHSDTQRNSQDHELKVFAQSQPSAMRLISMSKVSGIGP